MKHACMAAAALPLLGRSTPEEKRLKRPNFLFILTDDQRWDAMGCMGHPFLQTPNIDRIRGEGALFTNAFVTTSLCAPSRASILTGCCASRHGINTNDRGDFDPQKTPHFPLLLQAAGYKTGFVGKWHLGNDDYPRKGFDYWLGFKGQGRYFNPQVNENGKRFKEKGYVTDILTEYALGFLHRQMKDTPFCLYLSHKAVHSRFEPAPRHKSLYPNENIPEPASYRDNLENKPAWQRRKARFVIRSNEKIPGSIPVNAPWTGSSTLMNYMRTLSAVDEGIGKILGKLETMGELDNTVIVFSSDNGYMMSEHRYGDKRLAYEESIRIPMLMRFPKLVKAGTSVDKMVLNIDIAPTFLDIAGVKIPDSVQGMSMIPLLGGHPTQWRTSFLYSYWMDRVPSIPRIVGVRTGDFKLVRCPDIDDVDEMYDLKTDIHELNNLARDPGYAAKKAELNRELERLIKETGYLVNVPRPDGRDKRPPKGKPGLLLDLSFDRLSQNQVVHRAGKYPAPQIHRVTPVKTPTNETGAAFSSTGYITFENSMSLHPARGPWTAHLTFKPEQDGIVFSLGHPNSFMMFIVEKGVPSLVLRRGNGLFVVAGDKVCSEKWTEVDISIDPVRSHLFLDGQKSGSMVIRNPLRYKKSRLVLGYHPGISPTDQFLLRKKERFLPTTSFTGTIERFKILRKKS